MDSAKVTLQAVRNRLNWRKTVNAIAAFGLVAYVVLLTFDFARIVNPGVYGDFGITFENGIGRGAVVSTITHGSAAEAAGLKIGDTVIPATEASRFLLYNLMVSVTKVPAGQRLDLFITRSGAHRLITLRALPLPRPAFADRIAMVLLCSELFASLIIGLGLVVLRPSKMTWGFLLVLLLAFQSYWLDLSRLFTVLAVRWGMASIIPMDWIEASSAVGFLVFCIWFPRNAPQGWQKRLDAATPFLFLLLAGLWTWKDIAQFRLAPDRVIHAILLAVVLTFTVIGAAGAMVLVSNYLRSRGPDRQRIKWVVLGLVLNFAALMVFVAGNVLVWFDWPAWLSAPWQYVVLESVSVVLPATVAYAVIRHRVVDVRFVLSRSLVIGAIASIIAGVVIGLDWLFSSKLPTSRFEFAIVAGVALCIGFLINGARRPIVDGVDALFFSTWYRTRQQAGLLEDEVRRAASKSDLYEVLARGVMNAFALTSAAVFERVEDGGFVRMAAAGWPAKATWHVLPDDPIARRIAAHRSTLPIDSSAWDHSGYPKGAEQPALLIPILSGKATVAILLYGAHVDATDFAPDELRILRRLAAAAAPLFKPASTLAPERIVLRAAPAP